MEVERLRRLNVIGNFCLAALYAAAAMTDVFVNIPGVDVIDRAVNPAVDRALLFGSSILCATFATTHCTAGALNRESAGQPTPHDNWARGG